jgi:hypothetical protein
VFKANLMLSCFGLSLTSHENALGPKYNPGRRTDHSARTKAAYGAGRLKITTPYSILFNPNSRWDNLYSRPCLPVYVCDHLTDQTAEDGGFLPQYKLDIRLAVYSLEVRSVEKTSYPLCLRNVRICGSLQSEA